MVNLKTAITKSSIRSFSLHAHYLTTFQQPTANTPTNNSIWLTEAVPAEAVLVLEVTEAAIVAVAVAEVEAVAVVRRIARRNGCLSLSWDVL